MVIVDQWQWVQTAALRPVMTYQARDVIVFECVSFGSNIVIMAFDAWLQPPGKTQTAQVLPSHKCLRIIFFFSFVSFCFLRKLSRIFLLFFLYMLNVIDKTQMLPVSANRINHLLQNGEKYLDDFFHPQQSSYDRTVGRSVFLADGFITRGSSLVWHNNCKDKMITEEKFGPFDVGSWHQR